MISLTLIGRISSSQVKIHINRSRSQKNPKRIPEKTVKDFYGILYINIFDILWDSLRFFGILWDSLGFEVAIEDPTSLGDVVAVDGRQEAPPTVHGDHISLTSTLTHRRRYELLDT